MEAERSARATALDIAGRLRGAGYTAYLAGGCVRDRLMGIEPKDYDVATSARPDEIRALFPRAQSVGEAFGVMLVRREGFTVEIATFRADGPYSDGRHPDQVVFSDAEHDARRRDFTVNGLFEDPATGAIIDYVGGRSDITARTIRAIGDPAERLREDRLRMLRAIRFASRFEFVIEGATADAIRDSADDLRGVSRERIGQEVRWMLADANRAVAVWELQYLGLDGAVLGEARQTVAPNRVGRLPVDTPFTTALAAWLLDRHDGSSSDALEATVTRWETLLVLSRREARALEGTVTIYQILRQTWPRLGVAAQKRLAASELFEAAILIVRSIDAQGFVDIRRRVVELARTGLAPAPLISGDDLVAAGLAEGPVFRQILEGVYDAQLEGAISTREAALSLASALYSAERGSRDGR